MRDLVYTSALYILAILPLSGARGFLQPDQQLGGWARLASAETDQYGAPDSADALAAARARIQAGTREALSLVVATLEQTRDDELRERLRGLLREVRSEAAVDVFFQALDARRPEHVRALAVEVLAAIGNEEVARRATGLVESGTSDVRAEALRILSNIRNESSASYLGALVLENAEEDLVAAAAQALGKIGTRLAVDYLLDGAQKVAGNSRSRVLEGLALVKNPEALSRLREIYMSHSDPGVRAAIAQAFGHFQSRGLIEEIDSYLAGESSEKVRDQLRRSRREIELRLQTPDTSMQ